MDAFVMVITFLRAFVFVMNQILYVHFRAARGGQFQAINILLENKADPLAQDNVSKAVN